MSKRLGGYYPPLLFAYQNHPNKRSLNGNIYHKLNCGNFALKIIPNIKKL
ncbi:hypothetical protein [Nostoc sp. TCL240-02]|nr:hypothetical protein [Nostoc sp. TCL240-02]